MYINVAKTVRRALQVCLTGYWKKLLLSFGSCFTFYSVRTVGNKKTGAAKDYTERESNPCRLLGRQA